MAAHQSSLPLVSNEGTRQELSNTNFIKHTAIFNRTCATNDNTMMDGILWHTFWEFPNLQNSCCQEVYLGKGGAGLHSLIVKEILWVTVALMTVHIVNHSKCECMSQGTRSGTTVPATEKFTNKVWKLDPGYYAVISFRPSSYYIICGSSTIEDCSVFDEICVAEFLS